MRFAALGTYGRAQGEAADPIAGAAGLRVVPGGRAHHRARGARDGLPRGLRGEPPDRRPERGESPGPDCGGLQE